MRVQPCFSRPTVGGAKLELSGDVSVCVICVGVGFTFLKFTVQVCLIERAWEPSEFINMTSCFNTIVQASADNHKMHHEPYCSCHLL